MPDLHWKGSFMVWTVRYVGEISIYREENFEVLS